MPREALGCPTLNKRIDWALRFPGIRRLMGPLKLFLAVILLNLQPGNSERALSLVLGKFRVVTC